MKILTSAILIVFVVQLSGCAAMFHGTSDQITIQSPDPDAKIYLDNMLVGKGTAVASVKRNTQHTIVAKKEGCTDNFVQTQTAFDPVTLLGVLVDWGIISVLVIDWGVTGAMWKIDPLVYHPNPICDTPSHAGNTVTPLMFTGR